ncbi:MAG TPA: hypothetical protein PKV16_03350 [Caldisericia bacterium]|nr:hypothetical protein [Caldisericia bacterium]HPF48348.1 hypothetical protein [Caldisericia bacterium]HPI83473.1 hypothetical protein [Caldisericia bacterium]HPQ92801.1 hypothetical protein [Caldisericia bacterium]HRV74101.1 hypothetical protein [Caldisericia bacterium]
MSYQTKNKKPGISLPFSDLLALSSIMLVGYYLSIIITSLIVGLSLSRGTMQIVSNLIENHNPLELPTALATKVFSIPDSVEKWIILLIVFSVVLLLQCYAETAILSSISERQNLETGISLRISRKTYFKVLSFDILFVGVWAAAALVWYLFSRLLWFLSVPALWVDLTGFVIASTVLIIFLPARFFWLEGKRYIESLHLSIQSIPLYAKSTFPAIIISGVLFTVIKRLFLSSGLDVRLEVWMYILPILTLIVFFGWGTGVHWATVAYCNHKNSRIETNSLIAEKEEL